MSRPIVDRLREVPLVAASGVIAAVTFLVALVGVISIVGPGLDLGGRRLGAAIITTVAAVAVLWASVVVRAVHGTAGYVSDGVRPRGISFVVSVVEGVVAAVMLLVSLAALSLRQSADAGSEALAVAVYAVALIGVILAFVSLLRTWIELRGV